MNNSNEWNIGNGWIISFKSGSKPTKWIRLVLQSPFHSGFSLISDLSSKTLNANSGHSNKGKSHMHRYKPPIIKKQRGQQWERPGLLVFCSILETPPCVTKINTNPLSDPRLPKNNKKNNELFDIERSIRGFDILLYPCHHIASKRGAYTTTHRSMMSSSNASNSSKTNQNAFYILRIDYMLVCSAMRPHWVIRLFTKCIVICFKRIFRQLSLNAMLLRDLL